MTDILDEREKTHGDAVIRMRHLAIWRNLYREAVGDRQGAFGNLPAIDGAVEQIIDKLTRIACGDPTYADHWRDIIGYARIGMRCAGIDERNAAHAAPDTTDGGKGE